MSEEEILRMKQRSGKYQSDDPLTSFFYSLMRDHVTPGLIENLVLDLERHQGETVSYTNGWLAQYAADLSKRVQNLK